METAMAYSDRIVQQALLNVFYPVMEAKFSSASFAYRPNLSYLNAVEKIADLRDKGYVWVFDADIAKFFDNIEHSRLLQQIRLHLDHPGILCLIKSWVSVGVQTDAGLILSQKGIPQGAVISPMLANIYLHEFDEIITASNLKLVRYADSHPNLQSQVTYPHVIQLQVRKYKRCLLSDIPYNEGIRN